MKYLLIAMALTCLLSQAIHAENSVSLQALVNYRSAQTAQEFDLIRGGTADVTIPYDKDWDLEVQGTFREGERGRILITNPSKSIHERGIEWFFWGSDKLRLRLYNKKINFDYNNVPVGSVTTPAPPDHQARTESLNIKNGATHKVRMEYRISTRTMKFYSDNVLVGDFKLIIKNLPSPVRGIKAEGFTGKVSFRIHSGNAPATTAQNTNTAGSTPATQGWNSSTVKPGDTVKVNIPFDQSWVLEMDGVFQPGILGNRFLMGNRDINSRRIDWFWGAAGNLCFRLAIHKIFFTRSLSTGSVSNPYPPEQKDHFAATAATNIADGNNHRLKAEYDFAKKRLTMYIDDIVCGDYEFSVKSMPLPASDFLIDRFTGVLKYFVGSTTPAQAGTTQNTAAANFTLDASSTGTRTMVFQGPGTIEVTPLLSTSGPAEIKVVITRSNGTKSTWLLWNRSSDSDPSPLYENGVKVPGSIENRGGNDWSPKRPPATYKETMNQGDSVDISLTGSFGSGSPYVTVKTTGAVAPGTNQTPPATPNPAGPTGPGWNTFTVKQGDSIKVNLPFDRKWEIEYDMKVNSVTPPNAGYPRMFEAPGHFIEIFNARGMSLGFRLANRKIWFKTASKGKVNSPGANSDHYLTMSVRTSVGSTYKIRVDYDNLTSNVRIYMDGNLIGDSIFDVKSKPKAVSTMSFPYSEGVFNYKLK